MRYRNLSKVKSLSILENLVITSPSFENNGYLPKIHTGFDKDISPAFHLTGLYEDGVSIVISMDDLNIPIAGELNHWLIWNIPKMEHIAENIPHGEYVSELGNAVQGVAWGKHRYRGPKQPFFIKKEHCYIFHFYVLDCFLDLKSSAKKGDLLVAMEGHILQRGNIVGRYKP